MTTSNKIPKEKLLKLRKDLRGHLSKVAKLAEVDPSTLHRVLNGDWENMTLLATAIEYRDKLKKSNKSILEKL